MTPSALDKLRDIHLPPESSSLLPAPGWWLLTALLILLGLWLWRRWQQQKQPRSQLQAALSELEKLARQPLTNAQLFALLALYKRLYLTLKNDHQVLPLSGAKWIDFIEQRLGQTLIEPSQRERLVASLYGKEVSLSEDEWQSLLAKSREALPLWTQKCSQQAEVADA